MRHASSMPTNLHAICTNSTTPKNTTYKYHKTKNGLALKDTGNSPTKNLNHYTDVYRTLIYRGLQHYF